MEEGEGEGEGERERGVLPSIIVVVDMGMDSSYCIQINVSVRRYIIYDITVHGIQRRGCIVFI